MPQRIMYRVNHALEHRFPEQRLFLKSDAGTKFIRLRPLTQAVGLGVGGALFSWMIVATSMLMIDSLGAGSGREQALREQASFEARLDALSRERDERADEAVRAQERFNLALGKVSEMQSLLVGSENRRKEMETGLDVVQKTLRRTIAERDDARNEAGSLRETLVAQGGEGSPEATRARDTEVTLDVLADALTATAAQRDVMAGLADQARNETEVVALEKRLLEERNDEIFGKLEEAVTVSMEPLDNMFRAAGLRPDDVLNQVRRGFSGQGGPITPLRISTKGADISNDELRANAVLSGLDRMALYRLALGKLPFATPIKSAFRYTSGFGYRRDPKGMGTRMHSGTDFAGPYGTAIHTTADGVVVKAGWHQGYGKTVIVRHDFGIETLYAHMSQIKVSEGQTVSRGQRIGDMGSTGRSTGVHLHYEVRLGGNPVNPMTYIKAATNVF
ncbi:MAG: DUF5930 domain-containing protein [Gemmobacter sp.]|nr:DUF5930 domain-containing protein [Gemmobacter sp.]